MPAPDPLPPGPNHRGLTAIPRRAWSLVKLVRDPLGTVGERFRRYGPTYYVPEGGDRHLLVTRDPRWIRQVLVEAPRDWRKRGGANDQLVPILGDGLLTADGEAWKAARRKLQPGFRAAAIAGYADRMARAARSLPWHDGDTIDVSAQMMALTLRIVCDCLFHHDIRDDLATVGATMEALHAAVASPPWPRLLPNPWARRRERAVAAIDALIADMVVRRRERPGEDLLSMLLAAGFDDRGVRDQLVTLFLAGHETTSHAMTWAWWLLGRHPEARQRLHAEVDALPADPDASTELPWVDAVVHEALRLYPPAYTLPRVAARDTRLGPWAVAEGTQVVLWLWHAHRDPDTFEAPDDFRPQRFLDTPSPPGFFPFGAGTRMCIGAGFARLELLLLLATLARRWQLDPASDATVRPLARVTLAPAGPVSMRITSRSSRPPPR